MHGTNSITMRVPQFVDTRGQRPRSVHCPAAEGSFLNSTWGTHLSGLNRQPRVIVDDRMLRIRQSEIQPRKRRTVITRRTNLFPILRKSKWQAGNETAPILLLQIHPPEQVGEARVRAQRIGGWVHLDGNRGAFLIARDEFIWTVDTQPILAAQPYASTAIVVVTHECLSFFLVRVRARSAENSVPGP
jgi:hypothetical protein